MNTDRKVSKATTELQYAKSEGSPRVKKLRRKLNRVTRQHNRSICRNARRCA